MSREERFERTRTLTTALLVGVLILVFLVAGTPAPVTAVGGDEPRFSAPAKPEDPDYTAAVKAIKAEDFPTAIRLLEGVGARDGANADAYNWLGYAMRRNGDPARSIPIYQKVLAIAPQHRGAHEYIGEAYLALDNVAKAREHLTRLDALCFFSCSEYRDLKKAIEAYEKSGGKIKPTAER
jgi:tetratricopeptide (TPR) repeat protein